jgi:hypothetical protein
MIAAWRTQALLPAQASFSSPNFGRGLKPTTAR